MLGYKQMKEIQGLQDMENTNLANYYSLTYDSIAYVDGGMANHLSISKRDYTDILIKCGAIELDDGYYFKNEDDVMKAMVMVKLIS
jgi:hypothetical protein